MGKGTGDYPTLASPRPSYKNLSIGWAAAVFGVKTKQEVQSNDFPSAHLPGVVLSSSFLALQPWDAVQAQGHLKLDPGVLGKQQRPSYSLHLPGCPGDVNKWDSSCVECV